MAGGMHEFHVRIFHRTGVRHIFGYRIEARAGGGDSRVQTCFARHLVGQPFAFGHGLGVLARCFNQILIERKCRQFLLNTLTVEQIEEPLFCSWAKVRVSQPSLSSHWAAARRTSAQHVPQNVSRSGWPVFPMKPMTAAVHCWNRLASRVISAATEAAQ